MKSLQGPTPVGQSPKASSLARLGRRGAGWRDFRAASSERSGAGIPILTQPWLLVEAKALHDVYAAAFERIEDSPLCVRDFSENFFRKLGERKISVALDGKDILR